MIREYSPSDCSDSRHPGCAINSAHASHSGFISFCSNVISVSLQAEISRMHVEREFSSKCAGSAAMNTSPLMESDTPNKTCPDFQSCDGLACTAAGCSAGMLAHKACEMKQLTMSPTDTLSPFRDGPVARTVRYQAWAGFVDTKVRPARSGRRRTHQEIRTQQRRESDRASHLGLQERICIVRHSGPRRRCPPVRNRRQGGCKVQESN